MQKKTTTIRITECYGERTETITTHRTADIDEAIVRACAKRYGKRYFFKMDNGLKHAFPETRYGQMAEYSERLRCSNLITDRIRISVL